MRLLRDHVRPGRRVEPSRVPVPDAPRSPRRGVFSLAGKPFALATWRSVGELCEVDRDAEGVNRIDPARVQCYWYNSNRPSPHRLKENGTVPLSFIVLDQNRMRSGETISSALDRCCRENVRLLIPDGAGFEFSKGSDPHLNWTRSLQLIAPFAELVVVGRKISHVWNEEILQGVPSIDVVDDGGTTRFRELLRQIEAGDATGLRQIIDGPGWSSMEASLDNWSHHEQFKAMIKTFRDALQPSLTEATVKDLRTNSDDAIARWLESVDGMSFVFQGIQSRGVKAEAALGLAARPSVIGAFISGMAALALYWIAFGGLESAKPEIITNDIVDLEYGVIGALSDSLLTSDRRLKAIHHAIKRGLDGRARWFARALELGPDAA